MEPIRKKFKMTGHFRVALKAQDLNVSHPHNQHNQQLDHHHNCRLSAVNKRLKKFSNENIEVITINDDKEDEKEVDLKTHTPPNRYISPPGRHKNVIDYDKTMLHDILSEPFYAYDIFQYERQLELEFRGENYFIRENYPLKPEDRAEVVNWIMEIQNSFALYHEALYMAVKISDLYLMRKKISRPELPLIFMTALVIAVKYDERLPSLSISDLVQQARSKFRIKFYRKQVISLEIDILKTLGFRLQFPLSYGFLRRFARCAGSNLKTLTLSRYILESSLLNDEMIEIIESKKAASSLLLAHKMLISAGEEMLSRHRYNLWDKTAEFYTGYKQEELHHTVLKLNELISRQENRFVRAKYEHEVFMSVARTPPLPKGSIITAPYHKIGVL